MSFEFAKFEKYCHAHLDMLPNVYQYAIHSHSTVIQFLLNTDLLLKLNQNRVKERFDLSKTVMDEHLYPHKWIKSTSMSSIYAFMTIMHNYDIPVDNLKMLHVLDNIDVHFGKYNVFDEHFDLRFMYCCIASLEIIDKICKDEKVKLKAQFIKNKHKSFALEYIHSCQDITGGYGFKSGTIVMEPHSGYTYCAIASLKLLKTEPLRKQKLLKWLVLRQQQDGGFQGRLNKASDVCYGFWSGASLEILNAPYYDKEKLLDFLLNAQSDLGGFGKIKESYPDPLHSYLGAIMTLMLMKNKKIVCLELNTFLF